MGVRVAGVDADLVDAVEVAYVVTFLASPKSIAINADMIAAGGGSGKGIYY